MSADDSSLEHSIVVTTINSFLYFYFYTLLHAIVARRRNSSNTSTLNALKRALASPTKPVLLGVPTELAVGFVAGVASRAVSTPLSVVAVRMQTGDDDEDDPENASSSGSNDARRTSPGITEVIRSIYSEHGLSGFWAGKSQVTCVVAGAYTHPKRRLPAHTTALPDARTHPPTIPIT